MTRTVAPLADSLAAISPDRGWLEARMGPAPEGWLRADHLASDPGTMQTLRQAAAEATGSADLRTVGTMMMWRYGEAAAVATTLFGFQRRVPDLDPGGFAFLPYTDATPTQVAIRSARFACLGSDPDAEHPDAEPVSKLDELRAILVARLEAFVEPVIRPMSAATNLGSKVLWGIAAATTIGGLADRFADAGEPDRARSEADALFALAGRLAIARPALEVVEHEGARHLISCLGICCRAYRWPGREGRTCTTCPLRPADERRSLQLAHDDD